MSISIYFTPQRIVAGRAGRFARRTGERAPDEGAVGIAPVSVFLPQTLMLGERRSVTAMYISGVAISPVNAAFTLYNNGVPAAGYNAVPAALVPDAESAGRIFTAAADIDLTALAAYPLLPGIYTAQFMLTCTGGDIVEARGVVKIDGA